MPKPRAPHRTESRAVPASSSNASCAFELSPGSHLYCARRPRYPFHGAPPILSQRSRTVQSICLIVLAALMAACAGGGPAPTTHRNVLLITVDSLRADHLGSYGYTKAESPNIDSLAAHGTLFARAVTPVPESAPAIASIFTGLYPALHGVRTSQ